MSTDNVEDILRQDGSKLEIGARVSSESYIGNVKYIGLVPPTSGVWVGVDWDDSCKGKHDGTHHDRKYFETRHPSSGSFIRPVKINTGVTVVEALNERYGLKDKTGGVNPEDMFVIDDRFKQTVVEMVGAEKVNKQQSTFNKLRRVCFYDMCVYGASPTHNLGTICPLITDLDLSRNLLSSWESVAEIVVQLPRLRDLNVSENRLVIPKDPQSMATSFSTIKGLNLNKMGLSWSHILTCCLMFPSLDELHACFNDISELKDSTEELKGLRTLNLLTNSIQSWDEVLKLGNLPNLESLLVSENKIKSVYFPDCAATEKSGSFKNLKKLFLKDNQISEWLSIDEMNKLQNVEELEIANNPILSTYDLETTRQLRIAKLETIKIMGRTPVPYDERKGAEIDYLKRFGALWKQEGGNADQSKNHPSKGFQVQHPRYQKLIDKWGPPEDSELQEKSTLLKDNLLNIKLSSLTHISQRGIIDKKLPKTISVQKLKTLIQRLFKKQSEPTLSYTSHKKENGPEIDLDNDMRQLCFYSIESGDTLHIKW